MFSVSVLLHPGDSSLACDCLHNFSGRYISFLIYCSVVRVFHVAQHFHGFSHPIASPGNHDMRSLTRLLWEFQKDSHTLQGWSYRSPGLTISMTCSHLVVFSHPFMRLLKNSCGTSRSFSYVTTLVLYSIWNHHRDGFLLHLVDSPQQPYMHCSTNSCGCIH